MLHKEKRVKKADSGIITRRGKRSKSQLSFVDNIFSVVLRSEVQFLSQLKNFSHTFLNSNGHSFEDTYLHQIEVPEARKATKIDSNSSIIYIIFSELINQTEITIQLLEKIIAHKANLKLYCEHIENNLSPIYKAAFITWEWALQGYDMLFMSDKSFQNQVEELSIQFKTNGDISIHQVYEQLLTTFYEQISIFSPKAKDITKTGFLLRYFKFDSILENIISLPLIRSLNISHILKILDSRLSESSEYIYVTRTYKTFCQIVRPIFKRVKEYIRLEETAKQLPENLQSLVCKIFFYSLHYVKYFFFEKIEKF